VNFGTGVYGVRYVYYDDNLGHNIPNVFWDFMNQSGIVNNDGSYGSGLIVNWLPVFGLPLSEAYWTRVFVGNEEKDVLVQVFERRTLTYTPNNPPAFRVEMGNVGRHYYKWRYGLNN
jgi:polysaccharide biosynthesis protein PslG